MSKKLYVVGIGPGNKKFISPFVREIIESCDVMFGGRRNLETFYDFPGEKHVIGNNLEEIHTLIQNNIAAKKMVVLVSGDPGLYSIMEYLNSHLKEIELEVIPGISSLQYLCSKLGLSWNDIFISSLHGRNIESISMMVLRHKKLAVFTGGEHTPSSVCKELIKNEVTGVTVTVGENLSYPFERILRGTPEEICKMNFDSLTLMLLERTEKGEDKVKAWKYVTPGIPDHMFIRGDVPMTKQEVRAVSISKLMLEEDSLVYDIGAGTGSVTVECSLICKKGKVIAVERETEALKLMKSNIEKFGVKNATVLEGEAPAVFSRLPKPDRIFIGGTGGKMKELFSWIDENCEKVRVVINAVTLESAYETVKCMEEKGFQEIDLVHISLSRGQKAGSKNMMKALNPVYIISSEKGGL